MEIAWVLVREVAVILLFLAVGVICERTGILDEKNALALCNFLLMAVIPLMTLRSFQTQRSLQALPLLAFSLALTLAAHLVCILLVRHIFPDDAPGQSRNRVARMGAVFPNGGFMGFPLLEAALGPGTLIYGAAFNGVFNLFSWGWSGPMLSGKRLSAAGFFKIPTVLSFFLGLALYFTGLRFPPVGALFLERVSALNLPLCMVVMGVFLSRLDVHLILRTRQVYVVLLLRNLLFPLLVVAGIWATRVAHWLPGGRVMAVAMAILTACPCGTNTITMPARYGCDSRYGAALTALSTIVSIVTLPLAAAFADRIL